MGMGLEECSRVAEDRRLWRTDRDGPEDRPTEDRRLGELMGLGLEECSRVAEDRRLGELMGLGLEECSRPTEDRRLWRTDEVGPGGVQQSGRRQAYMEN